MGWRLRIVHETQVTYQGAARASFNEARMTPLTLPSQTTLETRVTVGPGAPVWTYHDYWGTLVSVVRHPGPARRADRSGRTRWWRPSRGPASPPPDPLAWAELRAGAARGWLPSTWPRRPLTTVDAALAEAARERTRRR